MAKGKISPLMASKRCEFVYFKIQTDGCQGWASCAGTQVKRRSPVHMPPNIGRRVSPRQSREVSLKNGMFYVFILLLFYFIKCILFLFISDSILSKQMRSVISSYQYPADLWIARSWTLGEEDRSLCSNWMHRWFVLQPHHRDVAGKSTRPGGFLGEKCG